MGKGGGKLIARRNGRAAHEAEERNNPVSEGASHHHASCRLPRTAKSTPSAEAINEQTSERGPTPLRRRRERKRRLARDDRQARKNRDHGRNRDRASRPSPKRQPPPLLLILLLLLRCPRRPEHAEPVGGVQRDAEDEREVERGAARRPAVQRGLDVLVVELGGTEGRDGRRGIGGREAMRVKVHGEEDERGGVAGHGKRAGERARGGTWCGRRRGSRGEEALEGRARGVYEQGREDEIALAEHGLVVLTPEELGVERWMRGWGEAPGGLGKLTMVLDEAGEPPRLAAAGAARWTMRKVVMNGADPCASVVRTDDVRVRHVGCVGLSAGCDVITRQPER